MTKQELENYRTLGMLINKKYDLLVSENDVPLITGQKLKEKMLSLKYISFKQANENFNLTFEVTARNLKTDTATIFIIGILMFPNNFIEKINPNGQKKITVSVPQNKMMPFLKYKAFIICDGLSAESEEFEVNTILPVSTCFCNRDFTVEEFKNIVIELRRQEIYIKNGRVVRDTINNKPVLKDGKRQYSDITMYDELREKLFTLNYSEKIREEDANFTKFTEAINKTLNDYEINTCIRKIHFLAQCYHETQRFMATYELSPNSNVSGGEFYRGRGLLHITNDYTYKKLKDKLNDKSNITDFVPKVAKEINLACQASGYFWKNIGSKTGNISQYADEDDVLTVSKEINGYSGIPNGFNDRKLFTNILKEVMNYENCINKK